jgi:hypothetical protein
MVAQACVAIAALLACSCSNGSSSSMTNHVSSTTSQDTYLNDINPDGTTTLNGYTCPEEPNVVPDADSGVIFSDRWTVCQNTQYPSAIQFTGTASESQVCIFPIEVQNSTAFSRPDPTTGLPMYSCVAPSTTAAYASFANVTFNAVIIVELENVQQMQTCIYAGTWNSCPAYSYGTFR